MSLQTFAEERMCKLIYMCWQHHPRKLLQPSKNNKLNTFREELLPLIGIASFKMTGDLKRPESSWLYEFVTNSWFDGTSAHHPGKSKHLWARYPLCLLLLYVIVVRPVGTSSTACIHRQYTISKIFLVLLLLLISCYSVLWLICWLAVILKGNYSFIVCPALIFISCLIKCYNLSSEGLLFSKRGSVYFLVFHFTLNQKIVQRIEGDNCTVY